VEFALTANTRLRPDAWVVLPPRAGEIDLSRVPIPGHPDLAVEVISPSETASQSLRKADFYLDHGTREVWQIYPETREVVIYGPQGQGRKCRGDEALASWLVADLTIPVSRFFASE
jgi:Uma2 family endonuclease